MFLKVLQISQKKKHVLEPSACNFIKNWLQHRCFPKKIAKFFKNTYFCEYLRTIYFPCLLWNDCVIIWLLELSFPITVYLVYNFVYLFIFFQIFLLKRQSEKNFPIAALQKYEGKTITKIIRFFFNISKFPYKKATFRSSAIKNVYFTFKLSFAKWGRRGMLKVVVQRCSVRKVFFKIHRKTPLSESLF